VSEDKSGGPTAPKRPRIEPPVADDTKTDPETKPKSEPEPKSDVPAENKKRRWQNKKKGKPQQPQQPQQQQSRQQQQNRPQQNRQQQPQPKLVLTTRKNRLGNTPSNNLQRPAPSRFSPQGRGDNFGGRLGHQAPRPMGQVPSPWAVAPPDQGPWFGSF